MQAVGFIGLGAMGLPMAARLRSGGFRVLGFDSAPTAQQRWSGSGGLLAASVSAVLGESEVVITMLPDGKAVQQALLAPASRRALAEQAPTIIDMSSSLPSDTLRLASELQSLGVSVLDAPASGGVRRALIGELTIMVGGDGSEIERCRAILEVMGRTIVLTGELGSGHATKALNNFVSASNLVAACAAIRVGTAFGLAPDTMLSVLNSSSGRNSATEDKMGQFVLSESYDSGFALKLMSKDVSIAAELASEFDAARDVVSSMAELWQRAAGKFPNADHTEIDRLIR